ncbi:hypothetical protein Tco_1166977 [Tanacetum coccineum]
MSLWARICRWWNLSWTPLGSYADWLNWFNSIRLSSKVKDLLEGVLYITWWSVWMFRNQLLFSSKAPRKDVIFDDIVSRSFTWCLSRFPGGLIVVCKFRLVKSVCLREYPYRISWYQSEGVSVAMTGDKNGGDKSLSDVLKGIDNITTMLQSLTTRVEHTEAEVKELRQIQEGRGGDDEFGSFTLRQPHNQPTFQHQRPPQPHNHPSQRRQTTPQLQRPPPLHQQHPRQQYPLKPQNQHRFQQLNLYNDDCDDETSEDDFEGLFEANHEPARRQNQREDFRLKVDLPFFNGNLNIEDFLDWIAEVERFFEFAEIPENKQVKLVAYRLKGGASSWWEQVKSTRRRWLKPLIREKNVMSSILSLSELHNIREAESIRSKKFRGESEQTEKKGGKKPMVNPYAKPTGDKYYRCGIPGHRSNVCTKPRRQVNLAEYDENKNNEDDDNVQDDDGCVSIQMEQEDMPLFEVRKGC